MAGKRAFQDNCEQRAGCGCPGAHCAGDAERDKGEAAGMSNTGRNGRRQCSRRRRVVCRPCLRGRAGRKFGRRRNNVSAAWPTLPTAPVAAKDSFTPEMQPLLWPPAPPPDARTLGCRGAGSGAGLGVVRRLLAPVLFLPDPVHLSGTWHAPSLLPSVCSLPHMRQRSVPLYR